MLAKGDEEVCLRESVCVSWCYYETFIHSFLHIIDTVLLRMMVMFTARAKVRVRAWSKVTCVGTFGLLIDFES